MEVNSVLFFSIDFLGLRSFRLCEEYIGTALLITSVKYDQCTVDLTDFAFIFRALSSDLALTEMTAVKVPPS